eukprot:scaffold96627_cov21-Tisochrysis_lutea.AAC.4
MHDRVETSSTLKHDSYGTVLSGSSDILRQTVKPAYLMAANNEATLSGHCRPYMHVFERQRGMRTLNIQQTSLQNPYKHLKDDLQLPHKLRAKLPQLSAQCLTQWGQGKVSPPSAPYTVAMRVSLDSAGLRRLCT